MTQANAAMRKFGSESYNALWEAYYHESGFDWDPTCAECNRLFGEHGVGGEIDCPSEVTS